MQDNFPKTITCPAHWASHYLLRAEPTSLMPKNEAERFIYELTNTVEPISAISVM